MTTQCDTNISLYRPPNAPPSRGWIHLHTGCMFAGKTTHGLAYISKFILAGISCGAIKYSEDTRYSTTQIISHAGKSCEAPTHALLDLADVKEIVSREKYRVLLIDEFQFYLNPLSIVELARDGVKIILTALDGDSAAEMFPNVTAILPHLDKIKKHKAICVCGEPAIYTARRSYNADTYEQIDIGGADKYVSLCRACRYHQ